MQTPPAGAPPQPGPNFCWSGPPHNRWFDATDISQGQTISNFGFGYGQGPGTGSQSMPTIPKPQQPVSISSAMPGPSFGTEPAAGGNGIGLSGPLKALTGLLPKNESGGTDWMKLGGLALGAAGLFGQHQQNKADSRFMQDQLDMRTGVLDEARADYAGRKPLRDDAFAKLSQLNKREDVLKPKRP